MFQKFMGETGFSFVARFVFASAILIISSRSLTGPLYKIIFREYFNSLYPPCSHSYFLSMCVLTNKYCRLAKDVLFKCIRLNYLE